MTEAELISYEDLDLRIRSNGNGFIVSAQRGAQTVEEPFEVDLTLGWNLWALSIREPEEVRRRGSMLFDALMRGRVGELYQQSRGGAGSDAGKGVRLRILFNPRDERLRPLVRLPWEILYEGSADVGHLPALDARRPIVRTIDSFEQAVSPSAGPLERVLLALSNPAQTTSLDLDRDRSGVESALADLAIRPRVMPHATRGRLLEAISDYAPQLVHFMGHGKFDHASGEGVLLLEDDRGEEDALTGSMLATFFTGKPMPRLVILAACSSGDPGREGGRGPFSSVASMLVAAGVPAVIAMQTRVFDRSAIRFTERLYRRIVKGDPIEAAVSEARVALHAEHTKTLDWATPVLYVRGGGSLQVRLSEERLAEHPSPGPPTQYVTNVQGDVEFQVFGTVGEIHRHEKSR